MPRFNHFVDEIDVTLVSEPRYKQNLERIIFQINAIQHQYGEKPHLELLRQAVLKIYKQIVASEKYGH